MLQLHHKEGRGGNHYLLLPSRKTCEDGLTINGGDYWQLQHGYAPGGGGGEAASGRACTT